jgi:hypothetical protein
MLLSPRIPIMEVPGRSVDLRIDDFLVIAVFFAWVVYISTNKDWKGFVKTPLDVPLIILLSIYLISTLFGIMRGNIKAIKAIFYILKYFEYFIIYWLTVNIIHSTKEIPRFLTAGLITCMIVTIFCYSLMGRVDRIYAPFDRPMDQAGGEPATLGGYLLIMIALALSFYITMETKTRYYFALFVFLMPPLILTLSRASIYALGVLIVTTLTIAPRRKVPLFIMIVFGIVFFPILAPSVYKPMMERMAYTFKSTDPQSTGYKIGGSNIRIEGSASARVENWKRCFTEWLPNRPFLGAGITGVGLVDAQFPLFLGEIGLLGFMSFIFVIFIIYTTSWHILKNSVSNMNKGLSLGLITATTALLFQSAAVNTFIIVRIMEPFWFLTALVVGVVNSGMDEDLQVRN